MIAFEKNTVIRFLAELLYIYSIFLLYVYGAEERGTWAALETWITNEDPILLGSLVCFGDKENMGIAVQQI